MVVLYYRWGVEMESRLDVLLCYSCWVTDNTYTHAQLCLGVWGLPGAEQMFTTFYDLRHAWHAVGNVPPFTIPTHVL